MSTAPKAEHVPLTQEWKSQQRNPGCCQMLWLMSAVVFGLSHSSLPFLLWLTAALEAGGGILEEEAEIPNAEHTAAFQH